MIEFCITAHDYTDPEALSRRMAVREAHLGIAKKLKESGNFIHRGAILDESGKMIGSILLLRFETREALDQCLAVDPYITGKVWEKVEIKTIRLVSF